VAVGEILADATLIGLVVEGLHKGLQQRWRIVLHLHEAVGLLLDHQCFQAFAVCVERIERHDCSRDVAHAFEQLVRSG